MTEITVKEICQEYSLKPIDLARLFGIPPRTVQQWHAGDRKPPAYVMTMIQKILEQEDIPKKPSENAKRTLTITFEFDDGPWHDEEDGADYPTDPIGYAMDITKFAAYQNPDEYVKTELDGKLLFSKTGDAPEEVKQLPQYETLLRQLQGR